MFNFEKKYGFLKNIFSKKRIFLDYATSTPVRREVLTSMKPFWSKQYGNPGTVHSFGVEAKQALDKSRKEISKILSCHSDEIIFTSGGTESNSLSVFGVVEKIREKNIDLKKIHLITTVMEHPSILYWFQKYEREGAQVSYLGINKNGIVDLKELRRELKNNTVFVSIMYANNEIGTIQPISKIAHILRTYKKNKNQKTGDLPGEYPIFHTDASQAPLYLPLNIHSLGVDMLTIDGQKIYGPKGVGALFKRRKIEIEPLFVGGSQENYLRAGTENIPLIVGLAKALSLAQKERLIESKRLLILRNYFIDKVLKEIPGAILNGGKKERMPNNINISIPDIDSEFMIIKLDDMGVACSSKSACMGKIKQNSYVIECLGNNLGNSLRFTLGRNTTKKDIDYTIWSIKQSLLKS